MSDSVMPEGVVDRHAHVPHSLSPDTKPPPTAVFISPVPNAYGTLREVPIAVHYVRSGTHLASEAVWLMPAGDLMGDQQKVLMAFSPCPPDDAMYRRRAS
jgi:hypothetical protein